MTDLIYENVAFLMRGPICFWPSFFLVGCSFIHIFADISEAVSDTAVKDFGNDLIGYPDGY